LSPVAEDSDTGGIILCTAAACLYRALPAGAAIEQLGLSDAPTSKPLRYFDRIALQNYALDVVLDQVLV
jgi:hypothetical protein